MFNEIFAILRGLIDGLVFNTLDIILDPIITDLTGNELQAFDINIVLFSDTPILVTNLYNLSVMFFTFFYSIFFIVLLYKVSKKVIRSVFGVLKWW